jgi:lipoprotein-anchoring transpeptidase ErfK/SrfK
MAKGRHIERNRRSLVRAVVAVVMGVALLAFGGVAYAAYRYERSQADRIMPGVTIGGVDVSGMTRAEALVAVRGEVDATLSEPLTVTVGNDHWTVTPDTLGRRGAVAVAVRQAMVAGDQLSTLDRAWHRVRGEAIDAAVPLVFTTEGSGVEDFATMIARRTYEPARDASIDIRADHTEISFVRARQGAKLDLPDAEAAIAAALDEDRATLRLRTRVVHPKVTEATMGRTIVVRVDQNRLVLYEGFEAIRTFAVATAKPGYSTPTGVWNIYDKRVNPTWYNPALDDWGAGLPAVIPGGPGNPMGTRAIYIDAPGLIRIHGTTDDSSIGRYASHGCIRMHNGEIEQLFPMVPVGQHVIVVGSRPAGAAYWSTPAASDI